MDCLQSLPSLQALRLRYGIGEILPRSMDTATMAGWAVLMHEDAEVLETDCEVLRSLQYQVLDVDPTDQTDESTSSAEGIGEPLLASTDIFLFNRSLLFGAPAAGRRKVWLWAQRTAHCTAAVAAASFLCAATLAPALRGLLLRF